MFDVDITTEVGGGQAGLGMLQTESINYTKQFTVRSQPRTTELVSPDMCTALWSLSTSQGEHLLISQLYSHSDWAVPVLISCHQKV